LQDLRTIDEGQAPLEFMSELVECPSFANQILDDCKVTQDEPKSFGDDASVHCLI
jgi:hypothetical protein